MKREKERKKTDVKTFFSITVLINSDRIHNTIKDPSKRKKVIRKIIALRFHNQSIKKVQSSMLGTQVRLTLMMALNQHRALNF